MNFFVPDLSRDAAEQVYLDLATRAGDKPKHPTARLSAIRWTADVKGEPVCTATVGENFDCGPNYQVFASAGFTRVIIETETLVQVHTASSPVPVTIVSGSIIGREYFDDFRP